MLPAQGPRRTQTPGLHARWQPSLAAPSSRPDIRDGEPHQRLITRPYL